MYVKIYFISLSLCVFACTKPSQEKSEITISDSITEVIDTPIIHDDNELKTISESDTTSINSSFDKAQWNIKEGRNYPHREGMYEPLMTNAAFRSLTKQGLISFLGKPDRADGDYLFYTISQKRLGTLPMHTKTMVIKFTSGGPVEWIKIHE